MDVDPDSKHTYQQSLIWTSVHYVSKMIPDIFSRNMSKLCPILVIFGENIT